jgi:hypothetical protein
LKGAVSNYGLHALRAVLTQIESDPDALLSARLATARQAAKEACDMLASAAAQAGLQDVSG